MQKIGLKYFGGKREDIKEKELPTLEIMEAELEKELDKSRRIRMVRDTVFFLVVIAAVVVLIVVSLLPFLQITGTSMAETLHNGDLVVAVKNSRYKNGDIIAFGHNNGVLVKRVIALAGEWVDIDKDGNVYVGEQLLDEPYVYEKDLGRCNIDLPYQVPKGEIFVLGDHRNVSIDSRNTAVGCIKEERVVGEVMFRIWPLTKIGFVG